MKHSSYKKLDEIFKCLKEILQELKRNYIKNFYSQLNDSIFVKVFEPFLLPLWKSPIFFQISRDIAKNIFCSYLYNNPDLIENNEEIINQLFIK